MTGNENDHWLKFADGLMRPGGLALTESLIQWLPEPSGALLDVGCGIGDTVDLLNRRGYQAIGIDISESLIKIGHSKHPPATLMVADAGAMPFPDGNFTALLGECTFSILPQRAWEECGRVLISGGILLLSDVYARIDRDQTEPWTIDKWCNKLQEHGFVLQEFIDCSQAFDNFVAQTLWDKGTLDGLCTCGDPRVMMKCRPGYFIAVAKKEEKA